MEICAGVAGFLDAKSKRSALARPRLIMAICRRHFGFLVYSA
jgi:hypothetical protein